MGWVNLKHKSGRCPTPHSPHLYDEGAIWQCECGNYYIIAEVDHFNRGYRETETKWVQIQMDSDSRGNPVLTAARTSR